MGGRRGHGNTLYSICAARESREALVPESGEIRQRRTRRQTLAETGRNPQRAYQTQLRRSQVMQRIRQDFHRRAGHSLVADDPPRSHRNHHRSHRTPSQEHALARNPQNLRQQPGAYRRAHLSDQARTLQQPLRVRILHQHHRAVPRIPSREHPHHRRRSRRRPRIRLRRHFRVHDHQKRQDADDRKPGGVGGHLLRRVPQGPGPVAHHTHLGIRHAGIHRRNTVRRTSAFRNPDARMGRAIRAPKRKTLLRVPDPGSRRLPVRSRRYAHTAQTHRRSRRAAVRPHHRQPTS